MNNLARLVEVRPHSFANACTHQLRVRKSMTLTVGERRVVLVKQLENAV
jgi:hypothetical protein